MSFVSTYPVSQKGNTNTWLTPLSIVRSLGDFYLDPCAFPNHLTAKKLICLPEDGLKAKWEGRVWLNPPYGRETKFWLEKLKAHGNGVALIFARLETKWVQPFLDNGFFILEGRVSFLDENFKTKNNAGTASMLLPFGGSNLKAIATSGLKGRFFK